MALATSFLGGSMGMTPPGKFWKLICVEMQSGALWDTILRNGTVVFYFKIKILHVPCHIVSFNREYLLHLH